MASEIDIANLALGHLGDDATVSSLYPPEGSAQAEHCARFYPVARDTLLSMHPWHFAAKRAQLAAFAGDWGAWAYAYAAPADCVTVLAVLPQDAADDIDTQDYLREVGPNGAGVILTQQPAAVLRYRARVTDTTKFSPLFVDALAWLLASYLAGPIIKGDAGMKMSQQCYGVALQVLARATAEDANQQKVTLPHTPGWVAARGHIEPGSWGR
ncbi:hypothetical protein [Pseudothauera rhizosphaerae]|uniref:Phage protein n=1 Tax=Pseudothauera rhizosphaerae TaxID=2565932 RepID=A0A4S4B0C8_9RHOO|nr:hypothetical protein [Pseudothauera rhizosphaerae]THF64315.1 hypothetical protein E6O51_03115 [Pseudothauera rhizosphaerae]